MNSVGTTIDLRHYERLRYKKMRAEQHIWFIRRCIKEDKTPNFAKISTPYFVSREKKNRFQRSILNDEIKKHYRTINYLQSRLYHEDQNLMQQLNHVELIQFKYQISGLVENLRTLDKLRKINKIRKLAKNTSPPTQDKNIVHNFHARYTNLSGTTLTSREMDLLDKGHKYAIESRTNLALMSVELDASLLGNPEEETLRASLVHFLKEQEEVNNRLCTNKITKDIYTLKLLRHKLRVNDVVVTMADKGGGLVLMDRSDYESKTITFLENNNFSKINRTPLKSIQNKVKPLLKSCSQLLEQYKKNIHDLHMMNSNIPQIYSQIKIHKQGNPVRPIVAAYNSPVYKISKFLKDLYKKEMKFSGKFSIKNSLEFTNKLKQIYIQQNYKLISFDIENLFTNVPIEDSLDLLRDFSGQYFHDRPCLAIQTHTLTKFCLEQNYYNFNNNIYRMSDGLPMGLPLSPIIAEIFVDNLENKIHNSEYKHHIKFWARYVDDIFCVWTGSDRDLDDFTTYINSLHYKINFTAEREINNQINFLDLTIMKSSDCLIFEIFRKPTLCDSLIPFDSFHDFKYKLAAFNSLIYRTLTLPITEQNRIKEFKIIEQLASSNGFPPDLINSLTSKIKNKLSIKNLTSLSIINNSTNTPYRSYTFHKSHYRIKNILKNKINPIFKTTHDLKNLLTNNKNKPDILEQNGVYRLNCADCNMCYIGETGRSLGLRIKEHQKDKINSQLGKHLFLNNHRLDLSNIELLHRYSKSNKLKILESLEIYKAKKSNKPILNESLDIWFRPLFKFLSTQTLLQET